MNGISEKKLNYVHTNNFPPQRYTKIEKRYQLRCKNTQHVGRQHTQNAHALTKQKATKEKKQKDEENKQTKNTLHNDVLRKNEIAAR